MQQDMWCFDLLQGLTHTNRLLFFYFFVLLCQSNFPCGELQRLPIHVHAEAHSVSVNQVLQFLADYWSLQGRLFIIVHWLLYTLLWLERHSGYDFHATSLYSQANSPTWFQPQNSVHLISSQNFKMRGQLAALDHNFHCSRPQAKTRDGRLRYHWKWTRHSKRWTACPVLVEKTYAYMPSLLVMVLEEYAHGETSSFRQLSIRSADDPCCITSTIATLPPVPTTALAACWGRVSIQVRTPTAVTECDHYANL